MTLKSGITERKASRYWGPVVGTNRQRKDPEDGDEGDSRLEEHATYTHHHSQAYLPAGSNSMRSTPSHSAHPDDVDDDEAIKPSSCHHESSIPLRIIENIRTENQITLAGRDVMYVGSCLSWFSADFRKHVSQSKGNKSIAAPGRNQTTDMGTGFRPSHRAPEGYAW
jgi:hypothetical protein